MENNIDKWLEALVSHIPKATDGEKRELERELRDHIEDHATALMDIGRSEDEACSGALAAMGSAEEIGRELNKEFRPLWLYVKRICLILAVILIFPMLGNGFDLISNARDSYIARTHPSKRISEEYNNFIDVRMEIENSADTVYFFACDIRREDTLWNIYKNEPHSDYTAYIGVCSYDESIFGETGQALEHIKYLYDGDIVQGLSGGGFGSYPVCYRDMKLPVAYGQSHITAVYERFGEYKSVDIPLEWEGVE